MSQFFIDKSGSSPPPTLNFFADSVDTNNTDGIDVNVSGDDITYRLTNREPGSASSTGVTTVDIITFTPPATAGIYKLFIEVSAWDNANLTGSTWELSGAVQADGLGTLGTVGSPTRIMNGNAAVFDVSQLNVITSGGSIKVQGTGLTGRTLKWTGLLTYIFGGA